MILQYRDGSKDDDRLFDFPIERQRSHVADCLSLGPNWVADGQWERLIDTLLSVRRYEGKPAFYLQIGRLICPTVGDIDR